MSNYPVLQLNIQELGILKDSNSQILHKYIQIQRLQLIVLEIKKNQYDGQLLVEKTQDRL